MRVGDEIAGVGGFFERRYFGIACAVDGPGAGVVCEVVGDGDVEVPVAGGGAPEDEVGDVEGVGVSGDNRGGGGEGGEGGEEEG